MHPQWFNYMYHYGVGGLFFLFSMTMLFRSGALKWEREPDKLLVRGLVFGLVSFMVVHALWIMVTTN